MLDDALCPSLEVTVTVYVCGPTAAVSSVPEGAAPPCESAHELIPGANAASTHEKLVDTLAARAYVPPDAGDAIDADGGPTENTDTAVLPELEAASSPPPGLNATENGRPPVANGEPDTSVSAPVEESTENTDTV
jgi:hypothetical protein